jgi:hypothetical protein
MNATPDELDMGTGVSGAPACQTREIVVAERGLTISSVEGGAPRLEEDRDAGCVGFRQSDTWCRGRFLSETLGSSRRRLVLGGHP